MYRGMCHNCSNQLATFGCFCGKCLVDMKKDKDFYRAIEFGSGELWKVN